MDERIFENRREAGEHLAYLMEDRKFERPIVLGLARGGVVVAKPIADRLGAPFDVFLVRKIGAPMQPEFAVGAIAEGGEPIYDQSSLAMFGLDEIRLKPIELRERDELERRIAHYRAGRSIPSLRGRTVILIDDGLATGLSAIAAIEAIRRQDPLQIIFAAPVGASDTVAKLRMHGANEVICAVLPSRFNAVGHWYHDFRAVSDEEVMALLAASTARPNGEKFAV